MLFCYLRQSLNEITMPFYFSSLVMVVPILLLLVWILNENDEQQQQQIASDQEYKRKGIWLYRSIVSFLTPPVCWCKTRVFLVKSQLEWNITKNFLSVSWEFWLKNSDLFVLSNATHTALATSYHLNSWNALNMVPRMTMKNANNTNPNLFLSRTIIIINET